MRNHRLCFAPLRGCALILLVLNGPPPAHAQEAPRITDIRLSAGMQFMGVATTGAKSDVNGDFKLEPVSNRMDFLIRRGRLGFSGRVLDTLEFRVILYYDNLGKDRHSGLRSTPTDGTTGIWDAFCTWNAQPTWANVTFGFFRPQIGRENLTSGFNTDSSMDKLPTQVYQRLHVVGRSSGREMGVNVGGLRTSSKWTLNYNIGVFDTSHERLVGLANGGERWSPLTVGRVAVSYGDPEMQTYSIDYRMNYFNRRNGVTAAVSHAHQGETNLFRKNQTTEFDILANYRGLNLDAELDLMSRTWPTHADYTDKVWHVRSGYNIRMRDTWIEPVAVYVRFTGALNSLFSSGRDQLSEISLNWYIRETRVRLNVHRTWQTGRAISNYTDGFNFLRGNMFGVGMQFVY